MKVTLPNFLHRVARLAVVSATLLGCAVSAAAATTGTLRILSANLKTTNHVTLTPADWDAYVTEHPGEPATRRPAKNRGDEFIKLMIGFQPDSIGLQEVSKNSLRGPSWNAWLNTNVEAGAALGGYGIAGKTSNSGAPLLSEANEYSPILYRKDTYEAKSQGGWWISDTPQTPGSKFDGMKLARVVSWVLLENKATLVRYLHVNCHPDTKLENDLGFRQTKVIVEKVHALVAEHKVPVVLTGDFNYVDDSKYYKFLTDQTSFPTDSANKSGLKDAKNVKEGDGCAVFSWSTSCGFGAEYIYDGTRTNILDRVCVMTPEKMATLTGRPPSSYSVAAYKSVVCTWFVCSWVASTGTNAAEVLWEGYWQSDHFPVYAEIEFTVNP